MSRQVIGFTYCGIVETFFAFTSGRFCASLQTFRELEIFCKQLLSMVEIDETHRKNVNDGGSKS